ncbi:MAG: DUF1552 domain-containing protein [Acidimicrobiia bacterium]|nr:DUF1552 domain-containing protein [Acidimicrobiia bacterium]
MRLTRTALHRRTLLRGAGATLALPLLDAMVPALTPVAKTAARAVPRLGFFYMPNGVAQRYWEPEGTGGGDFTFSPILKSLEPFRERVVVLSGLANPAAISTTQGSGPHTRAHAVWLNGVTPKWTEGADFRSGKTIDQFAADELGADTPLRSLEIALEPNYMIGSCELGYSCVYINSTSWRSPTMPLPMENNPRVVFERLFGDGGTVEAQRARLRQNRSILDAVKEEAAALDRKLGAGDRATLDQYLGAIRDVERRIEATERQRETTPLPDLERPLGIPSTFDEHAKLMMDLQLLAWRADITRVATFQIGREQSNRTYPEVGCPEGHHDQSHRGDAENLLIYSKVNAYHMMLFARFVEQMRDTPDGDGSLLDHSMVLIGSGMGDGARHSPMDLPLVLVGGANGRLEGNRHLVYPPRTVPMMNLGLSMLDKVGVKVDEIGDSTGRLTDL